MKRYFLDYNERQIVHAAVRMDSRAGKTSPFSKRAAEAIRKAKDDMDVGNIDPDVRDVIVERYISRSRTGRDGNIWGKHIVIAGSSTSTANNSVS